MNLSEPAADLLGEIPSRVLLTMHRTTDALTGREIARRAGYRTHTGVHRALSELHTIGLVLVSRAGRANMYRLNRAHVLWYPVLTMLVAPAQVEQRIADIVRAHDVQASAAIFGSFARGEAGPESDIDIVVVLPSEADDTTGDAMQDQLIEEIGILTGNAVQVVVFTPDTFRARIAAHDPFIASLRSDARPLLGTAFDTLGDE